MDIKMFFTTKAQRTQRFSFMIFLGILCVLCVFVVRITCVNNSVLLLTKRTLKFSTGFFCHRDTENTENSFLKGRSLCPLCLCGNTPEGIFSIRLV